MVKIILITTLTMHVARHSFIVTNGKNNTNYNEAMANLWQSLIVTNGKNNTNYNTTEEEVDNI